MAILRRQGKIEINYTVTGDAPEEEDLVFWLFKVARQFGLQMEVETENDTYEEDVLDREL